jgi:hypothetical protein
MIDSDTIVTRSLGDVLERAAVGRVCAFPDPESEADSTHGPACSAWQDRSGSSYTSTPAS